MILLGGLFGLFFLCLFMMMARRRRAASTYAVASGGGLPVNHKPMFGGPWGRSNNEHQGQNAMPMNSYQGQGQNYYPGPNYPPPPNAPYNPEYPNQHTPLPPPAYGKDAEYNNRYSPVCTLSSITILSVMNCSRVSVRTALWLSTNQSGY